MRSMLRICTVVDKSLWPLKGTYRGKQKKHLYFIICGHDLFLRQINTFVQHKYIQLIKGDSKYIYNITNV